LFTKSDPNTSPKNLVIRAKIPSVQPKLQNAHKVNTKTEIIQMENIQIF